MEAPGGVAIAAHPFRTGRSTQEYLIEQGLYRIVEGINGRNHAIENERGLSWEQSYGIKQVGGSDAHSLSGLGGTVTRFQTPISSRFDFIQALKTGAFEIPRPH